MASLAPTPTPDYLLVAPPSVQQEAQCIRDAEEGGSYSWGFTAFATGDGGGAYQFEPTTWPSAALKAEGVTPATHSPAAQDDAFLIVYEAYGTQPWAGDSCVGG